MRCKSFIRNRLSDFLGAACAGSARPSGRQMISDVKRLQLADAGYLGAWPSSLGGIPKFLNSKLAEMRIDADGNMMRLHDDGREDDTAWGEGMRCKSFIQNWLPAFDWPRVPSSRSFLAGR